jgi:hypothetical protein
MYLDPGIGLNNGQANQGAFGAIAGDELRRLGRFAGVLLVAGALVSFPAGVVLEPAPEAPAHLIGLATLLTGVAAFFAPWERMSAKWIHVGLIVSTVEIAAAVAAFSDDFAFFYVIVGMYAAYVIRDRSVLAAYMLFFAVALLAPLVYSDGDLNDQVPQILIVIPVFAFAVFIVRYLRDTLELREREYRLFAFEAVSLAERIRGRPDGGLEGDLEERLGRLAEGEQGTRPRG